MKRFLLSALFSFLVTGMATAQPPVDFVLLCDDVPIGFVSVVDGELVAAVLEGETCAEGALIGVVGDKEFAATITVDDDGVVMVHLAFGEGDDTGMSAEAEALPSEAHEGMLTAQEKRAAAMETAASAREGRPELPEMAADEAVEATESRGEGRGELPEATTEERGEDRPALPEAANDRRP